MAFKKGQSGNPGGRPPQTEDDKNFRKLAKEKSATALQFLTDVFEKGEVKVGKKKMKANMNTMVMAAIKVIEYGQGKPLQPTKEIPEGSTWADVLKSLDV